MPQQWCQKAIKSWKITFPPFPLTPRQHITLMFALKVMPSLCSCFVASAAAEVVKRLQFFLLINASPFTSLQEPFTRVWRKPEPLFLFSLEVSFWVLLAGSNQQHLVVVVVVNADDVRLPVAALRRLCVLINLCHCWWHFVCVRCWRWWQHWDSFLPFLSSFSNVFDLFLK